MLANQPLDATVLLITRNGLGSGPPELQLKLAGTYLRLLLEAETLPSVICFYTEGVRLVVEGSPVLELLRALEARGVRLVVCSTCLAHYGLTDSVKAGIVGGMPDIVEAQRRAEKVISV
jgi:intracellular sulfur oxidation DsrE/DsrF family protein